MCEIVPEYQVLLQSLQKVVAKMDEKQGGRMVKLSNELYDADQKVLRLTKDFDAERAEKTRVQALLDHCREENQLLRRMLNVADMVHTLKNHVVSLEHVGKELKRARLE